ncbi:MAG: hypothetical protein R3330_10825, partial [Saprospiraceae bacterium]|nr:hypothetical protein [Saprospiraceae bacterium]
MTAVFFRAVCCVLFAIAAGCAGSEEQQSRDVITTQEAPMQPDVAEMNLYVAGPDRILIDTREVDEMTLLSEVEEEVHRAKTGDTRQVVVHLRA